MKLSEVPMAKLMEVLPKLSKNAEGDLVIFNLVTDVDGDRVPRPDWFMQFNADGTIECGEGHKESDAAVTFTLKQGGINTMLGFMLDGLNGGPRSAMMSMMMGKIGIDPFNPANVKKTESFFKRVETGEEALKAAAAGIGLDVEEIDI
ncbi:MAG: hypothetical protein P9L99_15340 [Candidatus Lernaella stagnicola]|nr:hypothetical protein [Candidatus Lernaella stagnicola]